jgi:hypothetical protein
MPYRKHLCKACKAGDCGSCTSWVERLSLCEHGCPAQPRQLELPWVTGTDTGARDGSGTPPRVPRQRH